MSHLNRSLPSTANTGLAYLASRQSLPVFSTLLVQVAVTWTKWRMMRRTRVSLKALDAHLLQDIGISVDEARREAARPFWHY